MWYNRQENLMKFDKYIRAFEKRKELEEIENLIRSKQRELNKDLDKVVDQLFLASKVSEVYKGIPLKITERGRLLVSIARMVII